MCVADAVDGSAGRRCDFNSLQVAGKVVTDVISAKRATEARRSNVGRRSARGRGGACVAPLERGGIDENDGPQKAEVRRTCKE